MSLLEAKGLEKKYADSATPISVLKGADLAVSEGDVLGIFGASGSGKSTLLHILGGLDSPSSGSVFFKGEDIFSWNEDRRSSFRNSELGFVFQFYHLLSELNAVENVMVPALIAGISRDEARESATLVLDKIGLKDRLDHRPYMLSGGEQQRVAIARAVMMKPKILLADEPTGNLDRENGDEVWHYLSTLRQDYGIAMVVVSHNPQLIESTPNKYKLADGKLIQQ